MYLHTGNSNEALSDIHKYFAYSLFATYISFFSVLSESHKNFTFLFLKTNTNQFELY